MEFAHTVWYPKLTPYRIFVLFSTIGLGSAKAYAVSQDLNLVATYIEWLNAGCVESHVNSQISTL